MTPTAAGHPTVAPAPFAPELLAALATMAPENTPTLTEESIAAGRDSAATLFPDDATVIGDREIDVEYLSVPGPGGEIELTVYRPRGKAAAALPAVYNIHGGGMVVGHRSWEAARVVDIVDELEVVGVNVEYRLAPEHPYPAGVEDCYAGFVWVWEHAKQLGIDPARIVVMGGSAGGGFSAAISLMLRDRQGPAPVGQLLLCPMLDNTNTTVSSLQYDGIGTWNRAANLVSWRCVLGDELAFSTEAPAYASPTRAEDLSGLPPAFIEAGSAEMFRDEDVDYATRIWATGGQAELHIWEGGFHGFDMYAPDAALSKAALAARFSWLRRVLGL